MRLPSRVVEPLIALSIVYVAVENLATERLRPWRIALVFALASCTVSARGALEALGLPVGERLLSLLSFNVGVEVGRLAVACRWGCSALATRSGIPRARIVAGVRADGLAGLYWVITRAFG